MGDFRAACVLRYVEHRDGGILRTPLFFLTRKDVPGLLLGAVAIVALLYYSVNSPVPVAKHMIGNSREPDWACQYVPSGEPVCVKVTPKQRGD